MPGSPRTFVRDGPWIFRKKSRKANILAQPRKSGDIETNEAKTNFGASHENPQSRVKSEQPHLGWWGRGRFEALLSKFEMELLAVQLRFELSVLVPTPPAMRGMAQGKPIRDAKN